MLDASHSHYIGRFAPSPTGPLHLGSLYTALASFLDARAQQGQWRLRIDDLDTPRNIAGACGDILKTLEGFGLEWDGPVDYQSLHLDEYHHALHHLIEQGYVYRCVCSRKTLAAASHSTVYPGICRNRLAPAGMAYALRIKTDHQAIAFIDPLQGLLSQDLATQQGDFVLRRKEGIIAYTFAVVLDDARQCISHVVRGADLLDETPKQIYVQQLLGLPTPGYLHVPILVDQQGQKLSKQTRAAPVELSKPHLTVFQLLQWLKQNPPATLQQAPLSELLRWAVSHWRADRLQNTATIAPP